ncbi:MAG TPA: DUF1203 domain-containing protein [Caldimonas sp.]|jgi:hypothetical protein|nr:DUF1203 domain-containing protein [Caldimonas sp.]HEX2542463.1 DUF1203 domain-containing protein [Caldimonas sp.]
MHSFRVVGLDPRPFEPLFELRDAELSQRGIERRVAGAHSGFPCRVSLAEAEEGEELLLLPFVHQPATSPYHASGPIFVRRGARQARLADGQVPGCVRSRLISVRAYDARHWIVDASVCEGSAVDADIERMFADPEVAYIHLHNAGRGCFSCAVQRVPAGDAITRGT